MGKIHKAGLILNQQKCEWARWETQFLGYVLGTGEIKLQVDKTEAIQNSPRPRTKKQVRLFLELVGWYRRFVLHFSSVAAPLTALLNKTARNPVQWDSACNEAFKALKTRLYSAPVLQSPDFTQWFLVQVDASGVGVVLAQGEPGKERPVLYLSQKLLPRETRYSTIEKECLVKKWAQDSLKYHLLGWEFDTDHQTLTWIQTMKDNNARVTRWYLALQPFKSVVCH